jgi:hypothetical protein
MAEGSVFARVHVMVLCDEIEDSPYEEGVYDLRGVRTGIRADSFPHYHPRLCIHLQVTGHRGVASGYLVGVHEATDEEIVYVPTGDIQLFGPLVIVPVHWWIEHCEFPEPGVYWFQVYFNQRLSAERRFLVSQSQVITNGRETD